MKGVVFNLLEEVVTRAYGADTWDALLDDAKLDGAYTSLGSYDDADMDALVSAASAKLDLPRATVLRWFGQNAMPVLAELYPAFFEPHASSRPFIEGVNTIIHAEVRKLYTGAECPHFHMQPAEADALIMDYRSSRRMCALAQGFVEGAATHYGESIDFEHVHCVDRGDPGCVFKISWAA